MSKSLSVPVCLFLCVAIASASVTTHKKPPTTGPYWAGYGGGAQHDARWQAGSQPLSQIHWQVSLDDDPSYYGGVVFAHYASPSITPLNTVVHTSRFTTQVNGGADYDNWKVVANDGGTGKQVWALKTDYSASVVFPNDWTSIYPMGLASPSTIAMAGGGGTVYFRNADATSATVTRVSFYSAYGNYNSNPSAFSGIKICTPITGDGNGNIWFGYLVNGNCPTKVANAIGSGGFASVKENGAVGFVPVSLFNISGPSRPSLNAAPAVTADGSAMYGAISDVNGNNAWLVKLNAQTLSLENKVELFDPSVPGGPTPTINESSASPMIGPDGHVYMGVFGYYWRESHGWMLQFDHDLNQNDATGKQLPVGSFGWDDTACVVPVNLVPSYKGAAKYLILTKYNNYDIGDGDGLNKVAVLDPSSNSITTDRQSGIPVMNEILTVVGPTHDAGSGLPNAVREWCINSAAIDLNNKSAILNSEDGHMYRWSFVTNSLTEAINLQPATSEAYTCTAIGPDGQCYAINNTFLFACGMVSPLANAVGDAKKSQATQTESRLLKR